MAIFGRIAERNARPILNETASRAGRAVIIGVHLRAELGAAEPEPRACAARLDDGDADIERRDVLHSRLDEAFDSPLARVIQARARKGGLAAIGGDLDYSAAALLAEMRKGRAHHLDRAYQVSVDLVEDLLFRSLRLVAAEVSSVRAISEGRVRDGDQRTPNNLCFAVLSFA